MIRVALFLDQLLTVYNVKEHNAVRDYYSAV